MERSFRKSKAGYAICIKFLLALAIAPVATRAATFTWDGSGADNNWSTGANWIGNSAPPTSSSANDIYFAGSLRLTPNVQAAYTINSLTFNSGASSFTIGGSTLTINGGGITQSSANTETINNAITLGAAQTWNASAGNLTVGGAINNAGFLLTISGSSNTTLNGVLSGAGGLTKNGAGTLSLGGANTYTGPTTVNGGDLSTGTFTLTLSGTVSIASGATFTSTGTLNLTPDTSAAQTLISGAGTLRLRSASSSALSPDIYYDPNGGGALGYQVIIASNVDVGSGSRFINGKSNRNDYERYGGDLVFLGNLIGSANLTFTGTPNTGGSNPPYQVAYTLAGNNSGFSGGITLTDGANLILNNANALTSANTVTFTPSLGAVSGLYLYGRSVTIGALSGTAAGTMRISNGSLVTDNNATINPGIVRSNAVLTVQQDTNTTFNGIIGDGPNDHGAGDTGTYYTLGLTKTGTGNLTLGGVNTYTGITTVNAGTLTLASGPGSALGSTVSITVNSGATLLLGANNQINNSATMTLAGGTFSKGNFSEGTASSIGLGALTLTASGSHIDFGTGIVGILSFASFNPNTFTITIDNWTGTANTVGNASTDRLIFDANQAANLTAFNFTGYTGAVEFALGAGFYEVVPLIGPVPEPPTWLAGAFALGVIGFNVAARSRRVGKWTMF